MTCREVSSCGMIMNDKDSRETEKLTCFLHWNPLGNPIHFSRQCVSNLCHRVPTKVFITALSYVDKYDIIKQCKQNSGESASRLTATCDLLTTYCKFRDSINIKIQVVYREVVQRHALLHSRQNKFFNDIISREKSRLITSKLGKLTKNLRFSVLSMKIPIFYLVRLCRFVNKYRHFGEFTGSNLRVLQEDVMTQDTDIIFIGDISKYL